MKMIAYAKLVARYWRMANDPRTPKIVKVLIVGGLMYTLSPIDILPDWVPFLGLLDDAAVLPSLIALSMLFIPKEVKQSHDKQEARELVVHREEGKIQARQGDLELEAISRTGSPRIPSA